jgi:hypothetical protein
MLTDKTSLMLIFKGFAYGSCTRRVIFIPHGFSNKVLASMPKYKIRVLPVLCGDCEDIIKKVGLSITRPSIREMTKDEVKALLAFKRMQSLLNAKVVVDPLVAGLGVVTMASIRQDFKRRCDIMSLYVSRSIVDYMFGPLPASFF